MTDRNGVTEGYSSPMRRISEMPWVKQTIQIGLHAFGAADQFKDALTAGNLLITEQEVHLKGVPAILDMIPAGENYFITIDMDGIETTFMPAVSHPEPGGLTFRESVDLLCGLAARGRIVGMDWVEFVPDHDLNGLVGHSVGRLIANLLQSWSTPASSESADGLHRRPHRSYCLAMKTKQFRYRSEPGRRDL